MVVVLACQAMVPQTGDSVLQVLDLSGEAQPEARADERILRVQQFQVVSLGAASHTSVDSNGSGVQWRRISGVPGSAAILAFSCFFFRAICLPEPCQKSVSRRLARDKRRRFGSAANRLRQTRIACGRAFRPQIVYENRSRWSVNPAAKAKPPGTCRR